MAALTMAQAYAEGMREEMSRDPSIVVLGTDILDRGGNFAQLQGVGREFGPERVRDTPISEAAMVAAGVGAALNGLRPVVDLNFLDFALGAMYSVYANSASPAAIAEAGVIAGAEFDTGTSLPISLHEVTLK